MAINATMQWEMRPTTGSADNGGGYNASGSLPGTDYSQQAAAQVTFNGTTITASNAAIGATITISGYTVAATDNRNALAITGGTNFTAGLYEIISVNTGANTWTLDRNCTTAAGAAMTGKMGGARSGLSNGTTTLQAGVVAGNKVWIKNEAWNESPTTPAIGSSASPILFEGYNTVRGDTPTGANMPTLDRALAAGDGWNCNSSQNAQYRYLRVRRAAGSGFGNGAGRFEYCRSDTNGVDGWRMSTNAFLLGCEADTNTGLGVNGNAQFTGWAVGCYIHNNTSSGVTGYTGAGVISSCIITNNASHGINAGSSSYNIFNCTIDGNTGATTDGINFNNQSWLTYVIGNNITNNGRYGIGATVLSTPFVDYNNFFGNATAARNNVNVGTHDQAVDPQYTNRAGGDYSIGTNLSGLGFPAAFPQALSTGYPDIGAVQRQPSAGGGGGTYYARR